MSHFACYVPVRKLAFQALWCTNCGLDSHASPSGRRICLHWAPSSSDSYLNVAQIITAAGITGADAVHPGVGINAENAYFAEIVAAHGLTFIGPEPRHIRSMGDKVEAKITAADAGLPLVPGSPGAVHTLEEATKIGAEVGYPLLVKAASGGGGRGMKVAEINDLAEAFSPPDRSQGCL